MLTIRMKRVGRKNDPSFRVVVVDSRRAAQAGSYVEQVGFYNPTTKERSLDAERVQYWLGVGAQPSDTVWNMLINEKVIEGKKRNVLPRKTPIIDEAALQAAAEADRAPATPEPAPEAAVAPEVSEVSEAPEEANA